MPTEGAAGGAGRGVARYADVLRGLWAANLEGELQYRADLLATVGGTLSWPAAGLLDALFESARLPVTAYPGSLPVVLVYLLPMAWITTVPPSILTGWEGAGTAVAAGMVALALLILTRILWWVALGQYTSAGG